MFRRLYITAAATAVALLVAAGPAPSATPRGPFLRVLCKTTKYKRVTTTWNATVYACHKWDWFGK